MSDFGGQNYTFFRTCANNFQRKCNKSAFFTQKKWQLRVEIAIFI